MGYYDDFIDFLHKVKDMMLSARIRLIEWFPRKPFRYQYRSSIAMTYLTPSTLVDSNSSYIIAQAGLLIKKTKSETIVAMSNFVKDYIRYTHDVESLPWEIRTASNTLVRNYGNCADMSLLLTALLRAANIPARLVEGKYANTGLAHGWVEVYYDREWMTLDPTNIRIDKEFSEQSVQDILDKRFIVLDITVNENNGDFFYLVPFEW